MTPLRFVRVGRGDCEVGILMRGEAPAFLAIPEDHNPRMRPLSLFIPETELELVFDEGHESYVAARWTSTLDRRIEELIVLLQSVRLLAVAGVNLCP